ncbi:DUF4307 domain-containing protein [Microbacterium gorillae]|uniref:DUF4307 domain-containing protein n=1 Tax=Microbacterium gorillae TaxID=1231063 RepID=UPI00058BA526|nr:DUF4307 domain-containing protein [Microbacterium gorillae]
MTTTAELDDRYGRVRSPRRRRTWWVVVGVIAAAAIGYLGWTTVQSSLYNVSVDGLGFQVVDEHTVTVRFQFSAPTTTDVTCALAAQDTEFGVVGYRVIRFPAGQTHAQTTTETIRTVAEATTGLVEGCWVS